MWTLQIMIRLLMHSLIWISDLLIRGGLHVLKSLFDPVTLCCGYSKHRTYLDYNRDIVGKTAVYPSLSGPLNLYCSQKPICIFSIGQAHMGCVAVSLLIVFVLISSWWSCHVLVVQIYLLPRLCCFSLMQILSVRFE